MKKPEYKENMDWKKEKHVEKIIEQQHFCPVCDKPTVIYYQEIYKDGGEDNVDIDSNNCFWWMDPEGKYEITYIAFEDDGDDGCISFTPEELGLKPFPSFLQKILGDFYEEYRKTFNIKNNNDPKETNDPYFCSKECAKKFLLERLKLLDDGK